MLKVALIHKSQNFVFFLLLTPKKKAVSNCLIPQRVHWLKTQSGLAIISGPELFQISWIFMGVWGGEACRPLLISWALCEPKTITQETKGQRQKSYFTNCTPKGTSVDVCSVSIVLETSTGCYGDTLARGITLHSVYIESRQNRLV